MEGIPVNFRVLNRAATLSLMLALTLIAGCGDDSRDAKTATENQAGNSSGLTVGGRKGDLAPNFTLERLAGGKLSLSDLRGKTVLVDFWDTWCPPCKRALPHLQELSETYQDDLVVVGVALARQGEATVRNYTKANGLTFEMVLFDPASTIIRDFGGIPSIPTTFLIDTDGVIREKWVGAADKHSYQKAIVAAIGAKG